MGEQNYLAEQQKVAQFIRCLQEELEVLQRSQKAAGWTQRNSVISHVYSDYREQEKVLKKKSKWERITLVVSVLQGILKLLIPHRNIYGFYDVSSIERELEDLLKQAEKEEEFEIAELINQYRLKFS